MTEFTDLLAAAGQPGIAAAVIWLALEVLRMRRIVSALPCLAKDQCPK